MATGKELSLMSASDLRLRIKNGLSGCYLFCGPEDYMRDSYIRMAKEQISQGNTSDEVFAVTVIDCSKEGNDDGRGGALDLSALSGAVETLPPMFCDRRLVILRGVDFSAVKSTILESFTALLDEISDDDQLALIICASETELDCGILPKKPSKILMTLSEHLSIVYFRTQPPAKLAAWISKHFAAEGINATATLCYSLMERFGGSMRLISSEVNKLCAYLHTAGRNDLTQNDIDTVCSSFIEEEQPFAVSNAILSLDREALFSAYFDMKRRKVSPELIFSQICSVWCDLQTVYMLARAGENKASISASLGMHEFRVGKYLEASARISPERIEHAVKLCGEVDDIIKTSSLDSYVAIEHLIGLI